jgi:chromosome segregation ATPase
LGHQDKVTAVLHASLDEDPVDTGRRFVTATLGQLAQDPLISRLLQRLEEKTRNVYTETGQLRRTADSPLVKCTREIEERQQHLEELDGRIRASETIEEKFRSLTEQKDQACEHCCQLQRRIELLRAVKNAEAELAVVRAAAQALQQARAALAASETDLDEKKAMHNQALAALTMIDDKLRSGRERLARASAIRDTVVQNTQSKREARRAELVANRDRALRREQASRGLIQAREQLAQADSENQRARLAKIQAADVVEFASVLTQCRQANEVVQAHKSAEKELTLRVAAASEAAAALKNTESSLENAERVLVEKRDALAKAERAAAEMHVRREGLRASLIRAQATEQEAAQAMAQAKAAIALVDRLVQAEKALAELGASERELEARLAANAAERDRCESEGVKPGPFPIRIAIIAAIFGAAVGAIVGLAVGSGGLIAATAAVASGFIVGTLSVLVSRRSQLKKAGQTSRRRMDELMRVRQDLSDERSQLLVNRGVAQLRVDSARSERDQVIERIVDPNVALDTARTRLQQARIESEKIGRELTGLENAQPLQGLTTEDEVVTAERTVLLLKQQIKDQEHVRQRLQHALTEAQVRAEAAESVALSVDLPRLQERLKQARLKAREHQPVELDQAKTHFQQVSQIAADTETAVKVARGRISDAEIRLGDLLGTVGQCPDRVLAEAVKEREDIDKSIQSLDEGASSEIHAADRELAQAKAEVTRLEDELSAAKILVGKAREAHDAAHTNNAESQKNVHQLEHSMPETPLVVAQEAFAHASSQLATQLPGSTFSEQDFAESEALLERKRAELRAVERELDGARGQLELTGSTVARDLRDAELETLEGLRRAGAELELEFKAAKRLLDILTDREKEHAAHLGRAVGKPVNEMLAHLAGTRYRDVVLEPTLRVRTVGARGGERDWKLLSVGTRDQLATLVRLALAAHLKSIVLFDDQLAQSDHERLAWFGSRLRACVREHKHQIIVITCRPLDYLRQEDIPGPTACGRLETQDGVLVVDLEQAALRFDNEDEMPSNGVTTGPAGVNVE